MDFLTFKHLLNLTFMKKKRFFLIIFLCLYGIPLSPLAYTMGLIWKIK